MKALRITALGAAVILAAAALALVFGIPAGFLADRIQNRFESETGYRLQIADAKIGLWPSLGMTVGRITVFDKELDSRGRATAEGARIAVSLPSLFEGRPRLTEVVVNRPVFRIPVTRERASTGSVARARPLEPREESSRAFSIYRIVIQNGTVEMLSRGSRLESRIDQVELVGTLNAAEESLELKASGRWDEQPLRVAIKVKTPDGRLDAPALPIEFAIELPGLIEGALPGSAEVKINGPMLSINALSGTIGRNKFNGWASVDFADKPVVKVDLDFPRVDIEARPATTDTSRADAPSDLDRPWSDHAVNLDGLNFFDAEVQLSAAELLLDTFRFAPIAAKATLAKGQLNATFGQAGIYGGQAQGTLIIDASGRQAVHALRLDLNGVRAMPLLSDVIGLSSLDGRMQAKLDLRARGVSQRTVISTLSGSIELLIADGEIRNVNIAQMIRSLTLSTLNGWQQNKSEKTDLSQLSALFRIENGKATTDNLRLQGPLVRVTGAGTADLAAKTLQFKFDPKLVVSLEGQGGASDPLGFGVPVVMQGTWGQPRIHLDMAGILENPDAAYAKLRELGGGLFGKGGGGDLMQGIGTFLERLGRDAPKSGDGAKVPAPQAPPQAQSQPSPQAAPQTAPPAASRDQQATSKPKDVEGQIRDMLRDLLSR